jgi:hypothetical protein
MPQPADQLHHKLLETALAIASVNIPALSQRIGE